MSWFISTHSNEFQQKYILELGAGAGLAGFVVSQISQKTVITDGNEVRVLLFIFSFLRGVEQIVLRLIERNIEEGYCQRKSGEDSIPNLNVSAMRLLWGEKNQLSSFSESSPDIIIGETSSFSFPDISNL
jgi:hypothetical protein